MIRFTIISFLLFLTALSATSPAIAAPQILEQKPIDSPDKSYSANIEWDDAGFLGRIKMMIYTGGSTPRKSVELPQMKPAPANLTWISENFVGCESFIATEGGSFFYMDVERTRGYIIEMFAPVKDGDWIVSYTTNDDVSSDSISTISAGHSSLFPILLRELPTEGEYYFTPDFVFLLADAVDAFTQWRKEEGFHQLKFLSKPSADPGRGALVLAAFDDEAEIVYYPQGTTTTREMLALTQRHPLPENLQTRLQGIDPPTLKVEWLPDGTDFHIVATDAGTTDTHVQEVLRGRIEGAKDAPFTGPGIASLLKSTQPEPGKDSSSAGSSKSSGSGKSGSTGKSSSSSKSSGSSKSSTKTSSKGSSSKSSSSSKKPSRSR